MENIKNPFNKSWAKCNEDSSKTKLDNVCLCTIVRDEEMNPAGGIIRFIDSHVPFVESAVILDTGSKDNTYELLKEAQNRYSNLLVNQIKFNGFADARNQSLKLARRETGLKYSLILDADELITSKKPENRWFMIKDNLEENSRVDLFKFAFVHIFPDETRVQRPIHPHRLFKNNPKFEYANEIYESLPDVEDGRYMCKIMLSKDKSKTVEIMHFLPSEEGVDLKESYFYNNCGFGSFFYEKVIEKNIAPSEVRGFNIWKKYNPKRDNFK
ncbi:glycosyltransferase [Candidatus Pacearchaeota archaeon]|nr:glycosyltransferase [Candidatus Pacearchaeota archaeon]